MKSLKPQKNVKDSPNDEFDKLKPKKKMTSNPGKVNLKSTKFWKEIYNQEGEEIEKYRS
jgi:hypothetical protein